MGANFQKEKEEISVNEDELIGYIMRKTGRDHTLYYEDVRAVLDAELDFLREKGIVKEAKE